MKFHHLLLISLMTLPWFSGCTSHALEPKPKTEKEYLEISVEEYVSRMKAAWLGQMAGVGIGAPTEFVYVGKIVPEKVVPTWKPEWINQFWQDDLYVEMTFLKSLEDYGWDVTPKQAGIDFAKSGYPLWHANSNGRKNLREGIAPPDSGHPKFNSHADDIDYQIESDYSGLIAPGMPNVPIKLGETFGRLMNYGDGLYGGQFVGGMYTAAFFESDPEKIIKAGLKCIPSESQYAECIRDVLEWWKLNPDDWEATWNLVEEKYNKNPDYRKASCGGREGFNIDAKINGAYIVIGLLYGNQDPDKTIIIATRCGQDSDCNPSSAAGILFTSLGLNQIPEKFKSELMLDTPFIHTNYSFAKLLEVCETLARDSVVRNGGKVIKDDNGKDIFLIKRQDPVPSPFEQSWNPGPIAESRYSESELESKIRSQIISQGRPDMSKVLNEFSPGWKIKGCGLEMDPGLREEYLESKNVLVTHPDHALVPCVIYREVAIPEDAQASLLLRTTHDQMGDWQLVIKINGKTVKNMPVSKETVRDKWLEVDVDLKEYAGQTVNIEIFNQASDWFYEAAYWSEITLKGI